MLSFTIPQETEAFTGWSVANEAGGSGNFFVDTPGTTTPLSGYGTVANPGGGSFYAVSDQTGWGTHVLYQSFTVPASFTALTLTFQMFVNDWDAGPIVNPAELTYTAGPNQHGRVDMS